MQSKAHIHLNRHSFDMLGRPITVIGHQLETGDVLEPTDVYESTNGRWEPCPCPGLTLTAGDEVTWVRPGELL